MVLLANFMIINFLFLSFIVFMVCPLKVFVKFLQGVLRITVMRLEIWVMWYMSVAALREQVLVPGLLDQ